MAAPRCYTKHQRHRRLARVRQGANQFSAFIAAEVAKLSSSTATIFGKLNKYSAARIKTATNISQIP